MPAAKARRLVVSAMAIVIAATMSVGIAYATTASSGSVKACVNSKGVLVVPSTKGKCPQGTTAVTIDQRGPTGATGPAGPTGATGPAGPAGPSDSYVDTLHNRSVPLGSSSQPYIAVANMNIPAGAFTFEATIDLENTDTSPEYATCGLQKADPTTSVTTLGIFSAVYLPATNPGYGTVQIAGTTDYVDPSVLSVLCYGGTTKQVVQDVTLIATKVGTLTATGDGQL